MLELCLKIMLYNRKFIHLQCVFHSIRLRLRLTKIGCRETIKPAIDCISRTPICFNMGLNLSRNKFKTTSKNS